MRSLLILAMAVLTGCSTLLGIEDPSTGGDDGDDTGPRTLTSIKVSPDPLELPLGVSQQLTATGMFSDGSSDDVTAQTTWAVASGDSISITAAGLVKALVPGPSMVTATVGSIVGNTVATVGTAAPDHVVFLTANFKLAQQQVVRVKVQLVLTDGSTQDATGTATLTSDNDAIATGGPGVVNGGTTAGTATITATAFTATPATVLATVSANQCHPVINEFTTGSAVSANDEWVEVYNPCTGSIDVDGWTLDYRAAATTGTIDSNLMVTLVGQMLPGELRLFVGPSFSGVAIPDGSWAGGILQQNNGAVGLRSGPKDTGPLVDSVAYGNVSAANPFIETAATPAMMNDRSAARLPFDGRDDGGLNEIGDNANNFMIIPAPTPRALNVP